jgi:hypothetical protein
MAKAAKVESLFPPRSHESGEETGRSRVRVTTLQII